MTDHPRSGPLTRLRPAAAVLLRRRFDIRLHGRENFPADGPVVLACNHTGIVDGPILAIAGPRPVHALTKVEMFQGRSGRFLHFSGQIPLDRHAVDRRAIRIAERVLDEGHVVGIFPEGSRGEGDLWRFNGGAAYLSMVTGAPVVPTVMLGSRLPGQGLGAVPPRGSRIDIVYGAPWHATVTAWPRTQPAIDAESRHLKERMLALLDEAIAMTGQRLPGTAPEHEGQSRD